MLVLPPFRLVHQDTMLMWQPPPNASVNLFIGELII